MQFILISNIIYVPLLLIPILTNEAAVFPLHVLRRNPTCERPPQDTLKFSVSKFTAASAQLPFNPPEDESLAEAVCCDTVYTGYAEPKNFFSRPEVNFLNAIEPESHANVTFFDSVCGMPLFIAPIDRSWDDFQLDTMRHGWPSFRPEEVIKGNVVVVDYFDGRLQVVESLCGTRLGTIEPDEDGEWRYCVDVSCIAGRPMQKDKGGAVEN